MTNSSATGSLSAQEDRGRNELCVLCALCANLPLCRNRANNVNVDPACAIFCVVQRKK
jgi:hypothetical protein